MDEFRKNGYPAGLLLRLLGFPRSTYYYVAGDKAAGRKCSTMTATKAGLLVHDAILIEQVKDLLGEEFVDYGYRKVTHWLRWKQSYIINHKKVLRLMREHKLMLPKQSFSAAFGRKRIVEKVPQPSGPGEWIEFDIKSIRVHGQRKNALLLNFIDLFHREWLPFYVNWNIKKEHVMKMFKELFKDPQKVKIRLRSDNGSQFTAGELAQLVAEMGIEHEFIRPASPEENGHIESFHSVMQRALVRKHEFDTIEELRETLDRFRQFYNNERLHSAICFRPPMEFLRLYNLGLVQEKFDTRNRRKFILSKEEQLSSPFSEQCSFLHNNLS